MKVGVAGDVLLSRVPSEVLREESVLVGLWDPVEHRVLAVPGLLVERADGHAGGVDAIALALDAEEMGLVSLLTKLAMNSR